MEEKQRKQSYEITMGYYLFIFNAMHPAVLEKTTKKPSFSVNKTLLILIIISHMHNATYFTQSGSSSSHSILQNVNII
jgi:hypothetical protein